jgi:hypothetical protein
MHRTTFCPRLGAVKCSVCAGPRCTNKPRFEAQLRNRARGPHIVDVSTQQPPRVTFGPQALLVVFAAAALALLVGYGVGKTRVPTLPPASSSVTVVRMTPSVIVALRDLARLESAEAHMERVIDLRDKQSRLFGLIQAEDAMLLVASGTVVAGVDLSKLREGDVVIDEEKKRATIRLPAPEILSARLDNERTFVHTRNTDVLAKRKESLETEARKEAERSLKEAAQDSGVIERARKNAASTVRSLVQALGYKDVSVEFR